MEDGGAVDHDLREGGQGRLHGDDGGGGDGELDPPRRGQPGQGSPGDDQEDARDERGEQGDPQRAGSGRQGPPVAALRQRPVPEDEVVGHRVGPHLVAAPRRRHPPAHHAADVAVGDVGVVDLVVHPGGEHRAHSGGQHGEQEQRQHERIEDRQHAAGRHHPDQRRQQPLRVADHDLGAHHPHLGRLLTVGETVHGVGGGLDPAHRLHQRGVRRGGQHGGDPPFRVDRHGAGDACQGGGQGHHQQSGQRAPQPVGDRPAAQQRAHGPGRRGQQDRGGHARHHLAADQQPHGPRIRPPAQAADPAQHPGDLRAHAPEGDLGQRVDGVVPLVGDLRRGRRRGRTGRRGRRRCCFLCGQLAPPRSAVVRWCTAQRRGGRIERARFRTSRTPYGTRGGGRLRRAEGARRSRGVAETPTRWPVGRKGRPNDHLI